MQRGKRCGEQQREDKSNSRKQAGKRAEMKKGAMGRCSSHPKYRFHITGKKNSITIEQQLSRPTLNK